MSNNLKILWMVAISILIPKSLEEALACNSKILQYYGLEGMSSAIPYYPIEKINTDNFCPSLQDTCCTAEDFEKTRILWNENSKRLKNYLTQVFRVLQKIALIQSSLIQFMPRIQSKDTVTCKKIDATFFNSAVKFDEVHFYVRNALEAFAYIQKGFYCMLCDPNKHKMFEAELNYGRFFVQMSEQSCDDLVFFFREYLAYKIYFFDPLVKTMNNVVNCVKETDIEYFDNDHMVSYQGVSDCLVNKNYCYKVCKEFRMGASSNLFIGKLSEYKKLLKKMEEVLKEMTNNSEEFNELKISDEEISNEFFLNQNDTITMHNMNVLKDSNLSKAEVLFAKDGIDLFGIAVHSNYFLTNEMNLAEIQKNFNIVNNNDDDDNMLDPNQMKTPDGYQESSQVLSNSSPGSPVIVGGPTEVDSDGTPVIVIPTAPVINKPEQPDMSNEKSVDDLEAQFQNQLIQETRMDPLVEKEQSMVKDDSNWGYFESIRKYFKNGRRISFCVLLLFRIL